MTTCLPDATMAEVIETTGWRRAAIALAMVLGSIQSSACAREPSPAAEGRGATSGTTPGLAASAESPQTEGRAAEGGSGLAGKMRALIEESDDAAAANIALMTFYSDGLSNYEMDEAGVLALGRNYLEAGDDTLAEVVFSFLQMAAYQVTGEVSADVWAAHGDVNLARGNTSGAKSMYNVALNTDPDHAYSKERLASLGDGQLSKPSSAARSTTTSEEHGGAPDRLSSDRRDDLARFRFRYVEVGGAERTLMISETCYNSGVLRAVAQWEDAEPWVFKSISDAVFEQVNAPAGSTPVRLEFELHHGHQGVEAVVVSGGAKGRFEEAGYLPDGFEPEMGTCD